MPKRGRSIDPYTILRNSSDFELAVSEASLRTKRFSALFVAAYCPQNPETFVSVEEPKARVRHQGDVTIITLPERASRRRRILPAGRFGFTRTTFPNIWLIFTFENLDFVNRRLDKILNRPSETFSTFHMSSRELLKLLDEFSEETDLILESERTITYPFGGRARVDYARRPHREVFASAIEEENYVDSFRFGAHTDGVQAAVLNASIFRDCSCKFLKGEFALLWHGIIPKVSAMASEKARLFENRHRVSYEDVVKPLSINYQRDVFVEKQDISELISALSRDANFTVAVHHANPYLRATLTDFADGSVIDLYVTSSRSASIVPGFRTSVASLSKLTKVISEQIAEGTISPKIRRQLSFEQMAADQL